jgi:hypothetical protein
MVHERITSTRWTPLLAIIAVAAVTTACDDDKEIQFVEVPVEVDRPLYTQPLPAGADGFLGYNDPATLSNPTCAECHAELGAQWKGTGHASAWADLQASGHASATCDNCHTVGQNGSAATEGGFEATGDARYHDVQCESCHGPGQDHVDTGQNGPLAGLAVTDAAGDFINCAECHNGTHHPFVEQWVLSAHAAATELHGATAGGSCAGCHQAQGALVAWGVNDNYIEKSQDPLANPLPITCAVCHDPHNDVNAGQLRFTVETNSIEQHLCSRCHNRRSEPDPGSSHGLAPHSPESALIVGEAGWFPPGANIGVGEIRATHGTDANPTLCARCHVFPRTINDPATGDFAFNSYGHTFNAIPCVDPATGIENGETECELSTTARTFAACVDGCHTGGEGAALAALTAASTRIENESNQLLDLLLVVDPGLDDPGGEIDPENPTFTVAEGAFFNYNLATYSGTNYYASTTHNPFLTESLLLASIDAVQTEYAGLFPQLVATHEDLQEQIDQVVSKARLH